MTFHTGMVLHNVSCCNQIGRVSKPQTTTKKTSIPSSINSDTFHQPSTNKNLLLIIQSITLRVPKLIQT